jgi:hypothetical protein
MDHRTTYFWPTVVDMLSNHTLFLNSRKNFNDPFDSQPIVKNDLSNSALRNYLNRATKDPFNPERSFWPAPGSEDTELGVFMGPEVSHGETAVYAGVQA